MKKQIMPGLLIAMIIIGLGFGASIHFILMPLFKGQLLHCMVLGFLFSLVNYLFARFFYNKYLRLEEENAVLSSNLNIDKLTGVFNRRAFENDIKSIGANELYSIIFMDIDNFRDFNNLYGHKAGDDTLKKVCSVIKSNVRNEDRIYRYGGEEIIIFLNDCTKSNALIIAQEIKEKINSLDNSPFPTITASMGVSSSNEDGTGISDIIEASDYALLSAKEMGKNLVVGYNPSNTIPKVI